jgi:hypothetical protein
MTPDPTTEDHAVPLSNVIAFFRRLWKRLRHRRRASTSSTAPPGKSQR